MKRRAFVAGAGSVATALVAGCAGDGGSGGASGTFRLLVSDQPAAIEEFDSLEVTLSTARVFRADEDEEVTPAAVPDGDTESDGETPTPTEADEADEADEDGEGFVEFDLEGETVDLTQVVGERAVSVLEGELEEGRYSGVELRVSEATGVVDGDEVEVTVPSSRLRIVRPFEVSADAELSFVFDIQVVQRGPRGSYNLLPVVGKSGVAGQDVEVEEVDEDEA